MKKTFLLLITLFIALPQGISAWGRLGHDAVAYIAELNLKPSAKKQMDKYLQGKSIVYYASWMDDVRKTPEYGYTDQWHTALVDDDYNYIYDETKKSGGDFIIGLDAAMKELEDYRELPDSAVVVNIKYIVHLVADMHCPGHIRYQDILSNQYNVTIRGEEKTFHRIWDTEIVTLYKTWGYTEWGHQMNYLTRRQIKEVQAGTPREWHRENAEYCRVIYDRGVAGAVLDRAWISEMQVLAEDQIRKAGYRLAKILNDIFG